MDTLLKSIFLRDPFAERNWDKCDNHAAIRVWVVLLGRLLRRLLFLAAERHDKNNKNPQNLGQKGRVEKRVGEVEKLHARHRGNLLSIWRGVSTTQLLLGTHGLWMQNSEWRSSDWRMENPECRGAPSARYRPVPICIRRFQRGNLIQKIYIHTYIRQPCTEVLICRMLHILQWLLLRRQAKVMRWSWCSFCFLIFFFFYFCSQVAWCAHW